MTESSDFIAAVQIRAARISVSASAARGQGTGTVTAARHYLSKMDLRYFGIKTKPLFDMRLNEATQGLFRALPRQSRSWGLSRKLVNIFLRDALYTTYLAEKYNLASAEEFLEIPLDSITSRQLRRSAGRGVLPRWTGVKHLQSDASDQYQAHANKIGKDFGLARVHLDTYWWGKRD